MTFSDRFPVPVRSAVKSNLTIWCCQTLSTEWHQMQMTMKVTFAIWNRSKFYTSGNITLLTTVCLQVWMVNRSCSSSLAVLDPRVGHTIDILSPFIPVLCHSDWLFHGESRPRLDVVHPCRAWPSSPSCTWHCSLHYLFLPCFLIVWP